MDIKQALKEYFGFDSYKEGQEELISATLTGKDALGIMPTGSGKSLCFQLPALLLQGVTIVVSPLLSLMKDQIKALDLNNIPAISIHSMLTDREYRDRIYDIKQNRFKIIYVSPERLLNNHFLGTALQIDIDYIVVDEAHCISQWGSDFRPSYLRINEFISQLPKRPIIAAYTATATKAVKDDIISILGLQDPLVVSTGFNRANLFPSVEKTADKKEFVKKYIEEHPEDSGIIYCNTRSNVDELCQYLQTLRFSVLKYHAGMDDLDRKSYQEQFVNDEVKIMVATNAFGMGIDKSNVRYVIHYNMPKDIESYYQEIGRAGRDGEPADCILLYAFEDYRINKFLIEKQNYYEQLTNDEKAAVMERSFDRLKRMNAYAHTTECYKAFILHYFGDYSLNRCEACENCKLHYADKDVTDESKKIFNTIQSTGFRYGMTVVSQILTGSASTKITSFGLDRNPNYGALSNISKADVLFITNELIFQDFLDVTNHEYPTLIFTDKTRQFLNQEDTRIVIKVPEQRVVLKSTKKEAQGEYDESLFAQLRSLRLALAKESHVPPYVIFSDRSLREMCQMMPTSESELLMVEGVGKRRMELYGSKFIEIIAQYVSLHDIHKPEVIQITEAKEKRKKNVASNDLLSKLKAERLAIAHSIQRPAFVVFTDKTIVDMAERQPKTKEEMLEVYGIGEAKFAKYGETFLTIIKNRLENNDSE
jgi:ATP-dependent DNA helicase RecQ